MKIRFRRVLVCAVAFTFAGALHAQVPTWPKTTPADITAAGINVQLTGADYGNSTFVMGAYFGGSTAVPAVTPTVYTSPDGTTWTKRTLPVTGARIGRPRFLNGKFFLGMDAATNSNGVPTGANGAILTSTDGITWTAATLSTPLYGPSSFSYGNGVYVAPVSGISGSTFQVITSADGVTWTPRTIGGGASFISSVTFFKSKFYAADFNAGVFSSADGGTWARIATAPTGPNLVGSTSSALLVTIPPNLTGGSTQRQSLSSDGTTFTTASPGQPLVFESITTLNGAFVTAVPVNASSSDTTQAVASFDGLTWATIATTANKYSAIDFAYGGGRYVFVGEFDVFAGTTTVSPGGTSSGGSGGTTTGTIPTTVGELSAASLAGKNLNFTIVGGNSPFESSGDFTLQLDTPSVGRYTIAISSGNVAVHTDKYTYVAKSDGAQLQLNNYLAGQDAVNLSLFFAGSPTALATSGAGKSYFEMSTTGANKRGTFNIGSSGTTGGGTTAPAVTTQPAAAQSVAIGGSVTFTFTVTGTGITYQWFFNGVAISGAINFSYTIGSVTASNAGTYTVTATNAGGSVSSTASVLSVAAASNAARLSNVSIRAGAGSDSQTLIVGVTIGGAGTSGSKTILVRGTGPALAAFNVPGVLADPVMNVFSGPTVVATNDDWASDAQVTAQGAALGAFPLTAGSKDSALVGTIPSGGYTVQLTGKAGATGVGLVEVYDATSSFTASTPRLTDVSARTQVGTGGNILITGFVIAGSGTRQVLIRATGPALVPFGVTGALADPKLELYDGAGTLVDSNDNWAASTAAAQTSVGAFPLTAGSKDAVLVATLAPGSYTAQVSGVGGTTGVALVEIYELP